LTTVELPADFQQAVFRYQAGGQWSDSVEKIPLGLEIQVATPRGENSRTFALEFDPQAGQPQG